MPRMSNTPNNSSSNSANTTPKTSPGYFDLQVNGYGGIDFNSEELTLEGLQKACRMLVDDGADGMLGTIITEKIPLMKSRLAKMVELREQDPFIKQVIPGFHIEGPFLNETPGYKGAHPVDAIHPANEDEMKQLLDAAGGLTRIVTLAPERDPGLKVTRMLAKQGITVSIGHANPTADQLDAAIDAGASMWTHLGNGCPMEVHRHENVVQLALSRADKLWLCFIADGAHVSFTALGNYLKLAGDRAIIVSDAMTAAGLGPGTYTLGRWTLKIGDDLVARAPDGSHLVGAALAMAPAADRLRAALPELAGNIEKWMVTNPRKAVGL